MFVKINPSVNYINLFIALYFELNYFPKNIYFFQLDPINNKIQGIKEVLGSFLICNYYANSNLILKRGEI